MCGNKITVVRGKLGDDSIPKQVKEVVVDGKGNLCWLLDSQDAKLDADGDGYGYGYGDEVSKGEKGGASDFLLGRRVVVDDESTYLPC